MGMCKGCKEVFSALEMKDGLCKSCQDGNVVVPKQEETKQTPKWSGQKTVGMWLIVVGFLFGAWAFSLDTTVRTESQSFGRGEYKTYIPSVTVNNIGLMQDKQNYLIGSGVVLIAGVLLFALGGNRREEESEKTIEELLYDKKKQRTSLENAIKKFQEDGGFSQNENGELIARVRPEILLKWIDTLNNEISFLEKQF